MAIYVLFNSMPVTSGQWEVDNERLCAMELRLSAWINRGGVGKEIYFTLVFKSWVVVWCVLCVFRGRCRGGGGGGGEGINSSLSAVLYHQSYESDTGFPGICK